MSTSSRTWSLLVVVSCLCLGHTAFGAGTTGSPSTQVGDWKAKYEAMLKDIASRCAGELSQLPPKYLKAIEGIEHDLQSSGDLQGVLAAQKEHSQFAATKKMPDQDEADLILPVATVRARYREQVKQLWASRDEAIVALAQQYTNRLAELEKQFTQEGNVAKAVDIQAEIERVRTSKELQAATLGDVPVRPVVTGAERPAAGLATALATNILAEFSFTDSDLQRKTEVLNRLIAALYPRGLKVRIAAESLQIESVSYEQGMPRYRIKTQTSTDAGKRRKTYVLKETPAVLVLRTLCTLMGLGYKLDNDAREIVLVDSTAPGASWAADMASPDEIMTDFRTIDGPRRHGGKAIVISGGVASVAQGVNEIAITLTNRVHLELPNTSENRQKLADIQAQSALYLEASHDTEYPRRYVEITVIGEVSKASMSTQLTVEHCLFLEIYGLTSAVLNHKPPPEKPPERKIIRIDDLPKNPLFR